MNSIILAAGAQERWRKTLKGDLPQFKSLIKVNGKMLIRDIQDKFPGSVVCTHHKELQEHSDQWFEPFSHRWLLESLFWTYKRWGDRTVILLGDVLYRKNLVEQIHNASGKYMFFANNTDILALYFEKDFNSFLMNALRMLIEQCKKGNHVGKLWHLYRFTQAIPLDKDEIRDNITVVHGSRDFDNPQQYLKFLACQKKSR